MSKISTDAQVRRASQCWASPWRVAERQADTEPVQREVGGTVVEFPVKREHAFPARMLRLSVTEMQRLAAGMRVRIGRDVLG